MLVEGMYVADRYEIVGKVGAGGMSDVFKAKDHILGRYVAIKVLKQEFSEDRNFVMKFRTEAQSAASLEHPNIVNIYDVGSEEGLHYIVMEYVEGITLKTYIEKKGQLSFKEAVSIAIQVARGIEAAHNKNIIHRDIKPQNIIISTEGKVKVTDFGIAKAISSNTVSSDVMGSVHYTSPEHARNGQVDGRSDIYSLGIVMYEMVTGRVPFDGDTTVAVAIQHLQEEMVWPTAYAPNLPTSMEKIILKCTQKNPDRRYQTIAELLNDLRMSLNHPNENFVVIAPAATDVGATKVITQEQLREIKIAAPQETVTPVEPKSEPVYEPDEEEDDEDESELNPKMDKAMMIMLIAISVIIVILVIYIIGSLLGLFRFGRRGNADTQTTESQMDSQQLGIQMEMVNIIGKSVEEAQSELNPYSITVNVIRTASSTEFQMGQIMEQDPAAGAAIVTGGTVNVVVCGEETETVAVPRVEGQTEAAAIAMITDAGLRYERNYEYSDEVEAGIVISQSPGFDTQVAADTKISLVISQGRQSVTMPSVVNYQIEEAQAILEEMGLEVLIEEDYSASIEEGYVMSQNVTPNRQISSGTQVTLTVSLGADTRTYKASAEINNIPAGAYNITWKLVDASGTIYDSGTIPNGTTAITLTSKELTNNVATLFSVTYTSADGVTTTEQFAATY